MTNKRLLKSAMVRNGYSSTKLASELGVSHATFSYRLNSKRDFLAGDIAKMIKLLHLSKNEVMNIFFADIVDISATE